MFPLAPLCEDAKELMPGLIRRMGERVRKEQAYSAEARELWTVTEILLGLRYQDPMLSLLMKEMKTMVDLTESLSYQKIIAKGLAEGMAKGTIDALRDAIFLQGKKKFGKPSAKVVRNLNHIADERRLTELIERLLDVDSWKDLLIPKS